MSTPHITDPSSDQDLGAALGNALHERVDGVPTLTPGFDGVERRAAQITRRRRALAGIAAAAVVVLAGIGVAQLTENDDARTDTFNPPGTEESPPSDDQPDPPEPTVAPDATVGPGNGDAIPDTEPSSDVGSDTDPTIESLVDGQLPALPDLVIANRDSFTVERMSFLAGGLQGEVLFSPGGTISTIRTALDGTVVTYEVTSGAPTADFLLQVVGYDADGRRTVIESGAFLLDVAVVNGVESTIVAAAPAADGTGGFGGVTAIPLDGSPRIDLGLAAEAEFGVTGLDWVGDKGVATAWSDLTEWVGYISVDGTIDLPSPTSGLDYNAPPYVRAAALSADGGTVYWAEGPDWDNLEERVIPREWRVKGMDLSTEEIVLDVAVSDVVETSERLSVESIHDLGTHLLVNRLDITQDGFLYQPPVVIDLSGSNPVREMPFAGIAAPADGR